MIIDILIVLIVIGAAWLGFQRGFIQPFLIELLSLGALIFIYRNRNGFLDLTGAILHANAVLAFFLALALAAVMGYIGAQLGGIVHKMPVVMGPDGFAGLPGQFLFGIGLCYLLISGVIVMNKTFTPLTAPTVNATQLQVIERQLSSNLFTAGLVDSRDLQPYQAQAKKGTVKLADLPAIGQFQSLSHDFLEPQLASSRLAPAVMSVGRRIPGLGHYTSRDIPKKR